MGQLPDYVRKVLERSLTELATDFVDIYMIHFPDPNTPIEDTLAVMSGMVDEGKVRQIGCSNFDPSQINEALAVSAEHGWAPFVCDQVQYSMIHREPETDGLADLCVESGVALLPYYPLANGLLTGKTRRGGEPQGRLKMDRYQDFLTEENFDLVEGIERFASGRGVTMVQVALGWLLAQAAVPAVTAGGHQCGTGRGKRPRRGMEPDRRRPGCPHETARLARVGVGPVEGARLVIRTKSDHEWLRLSRHPQDPGVGAVRRGRLHFHGLIAEADVDRAPGLHGDLHQDVSFRVGCDRGRRLDCVGMETGTGPADVRNLDCLDSGDHDVVRRVFAETLLTRITATGNEQSEHRENCQEESTTDHRRPM